VLPPGDHGPGARSLNRPLAEDLFALGTREAVLAALASESADAFGAPGSPGELVAGLARVGTSARRDGDLVRLDAPDDPRARAVAHAFGWVPDPGSPAVLQPRTP
jgi:coenzyme F420-0:L-glutamate ligase/coenzyme F420-1:gamma-L-glutamate ligase